MSVETINRHHIILASTSPRRHMLLEGLGIQFEIRPKEVDEVWPPHLRDSEIPEYLCRLKASAFADEELRDDSILITADTIVILEGKVLGKPDDMQHAISILESLSGKKHVVITAVCLRTKKSIRVFHSSSEVWFRVFTDEEIIWYVSQYKPYDKAGAYGVQEWIGYSGIEQINGSFFNVMGLPTQKLYLELLDIIRSDFPEK